MKKVIGYILFIIFLNGIAIQICKSYCYDDIAIEKIVDNEDDTKKSMDDMNDFLKDKIALQHNYYISSFEFQLKQYIIHIFQYKNPHHDVDIIPPETIC